MSKVLFAIAGVLIPKSGRRLRDFGREDLRPFQVIPGFHNTILEVVDVAQSRLGDGLRREAQVPALRAVVALRALFGERRRGDGVDLPAASLLDARRGDACRSASTPSMRRGATLRWRTGGVEDAPTSQGHGQTNLHLQAVLGDPQVVRHPQTMLVEGAVVPIKSHQHIVHFVDRPDVDEIRL